MTMENRTGETEDGETAGLTTEGSDEALQAWRADVWSLAFLTAVALTRCLMIW